MAARIRKGDTVEVLVGRDRGKRGAVLRVLPERERVVIERINLVKKHQKPNATRARAASSRRRRRCTSPTWRWCTRARPRASPSAPWTA